jgi:hypothetical protein
MLKKIYFLLFSLIVLIPLSAQASLNVHSRSTIIVEEYEVIEGNMYFASENLIINGHIKGDLIGLSSNIDINGQVDGDIIALSQNANINASVLGSVRVLSNILNINSSIDKNLQAIATNIYIHPDNKIGWDALMLAPIMDINGTIERNLQIWSPQVNLKALINRDFYLGKLGNEKYSLNIFEGTEIGNNLYYHSLVEANIDDEVIIGGQVDIKEIKNQKFDFAAWLFKTLKNMLAAILLALVLIYFWKKPIKLINQIIIKKPLVSLAWGALIVILSPLVFLIVALTLIGLPIAILGASLWLILIVIAKAIVAIALGRYLFNQHLNKSKTKSLYKLSLGVFILWLIFAIPMIGAFIALLITFIGVGSIALYLKKVM